MSDNTSAARSAAGNGVTRTRRLAAAATLAAAALGILATAGSATAAAPNAATALTTTTSNSIVFSTLNNPHDPTFNQLLGINARGTIAGYFGSGASAVHPNKGYTFSAPYQSTSYANENFPGSQQTQVVGINNSEVAVGFWVDAARNNVGFVKGGAFYRSVSNPASAKLATKVDQLLGVNNHNVAVGFYLDADGSSHAYRYDINAQHFYPVTVSGASSVTATGINNMGHITGFAVIHGVTDGFLIDDHGTHVFAVNASSNTQVLGINNHDDIVGSYQDAAGNTHGFLEHDHQAPITLDAPHSAGQTVINGLNDNGQLVGFFLDAAGNTDGLFAE